MDSSIFWGYTLVAAFAILIGIITFFVALYISDRQSLTCDDRIVYKCLDGLWTRNACNFTNSWIHVNINNMTMSRALEVCQHEVGHEIFAEICEKNFTLCQNFMDKEVKEGGV